MFISPTELRLLLTDKCSYLTRHLRSLKTNLKYYVCVFFVSLFNTRRITLMKGYISKKFEVSNMVRNSQSFPALSSKQS